MPQNSFTKFVKILGFEKIDSKYYPAFAFIDAKFKDNRKVSIDVVEFMAKELISKKKIDIDLVNAINFLSLIKNLLKKLSLVALISIIRKIQIFRILFLL
jgi:hypothetical protein